MVTPRQNLVGPAVRALRVNAGLSQEAFAGKLQLAGWDISCGGLAKIETRLRRVNDAELCVLARVIGCEIKDLIPKDAKTLIEVLRHGRD